MVDELLSESSILSRVSVSAIFESNLPFISDQCDEIIKHEEAVWTRLLRYWCTLGREECKMSSSEIQKKQGKLAEIDIIVALEKW